MSQRRYLLIVSMILLAAFALRCGAAIWWQNRSAPLAGERFMFGDSESYWVLATQIAMGQPYEYGGPDSKIFRVPLYPIMLAPLIDIDNPSGRILHARILGCVLGVLAVAGVMYLAHCFFDPTVALAAGAIAAVYPGAISMSIFVLSEAPFSPLMVANLLLWVIAYRNSSARRCAGVSFASGIVTGLAVLARPSWLLFVPFALFFQSFTKQYRRTAVMAVAMSMGFVVTMSPWWLRNYDVTGRFVLTTLQVGASMYDGLSPTATGASDMDFATEFMIAQRKQDEEQPADLDSTFEYRLDRRLKDASVNWAMDNPGRVGELAFIKLIRIWRPYPAADQIPSTSIRLASAIGMLGIFVPAIGGLWRYRDKGWPLVLVCLPVLYFTALHMVFIGSMRYRIPAVFMLTVAAAPMWVSWLRLRSITIEEAQS